MVPIRKILIANRGEIALRIIKTCNLMGIATVAVFSDADQDGLFVRQADEAVALEASLSRDSYLNQEKQIGAALKTGADAIHPGYGFLSENMNFASRCVEAGLIFIGPSPQSMSQMASKIEARQLVASLRIPVVPGYDENVDSEDPTTAFSQAARQMGTPSYSKLLPGVGGSACGSSESRTN